MSLSITYPVLKLQESSWKLGIVIICCYFRNCTKQKCGKIHELSLGWTGKRPLVPALNTKIKKVERNEAQSSHLLISNIFKSKYSTFLRSQNYYFITTGMSGKVCWGGEWGVSSPTADTETKHFLEQMSLTNVCFYFLCLTGLKNVWKGNKT